MISQHTGKMTPAGFNANSVELDAIKRCSAKKRESQAGWIRRTLMQAAAEELGVPYATLDRFSPAYGTGPRAVAAVPAEPTRHGLARVEASDRLAALQSEADRAQAAVDAKRAAAAKLAEALAELDALGGDEPTGVKPRRRR